MAKYPFAQARWIGVQCLFSVGMFRLDLSRETSAFTSSRSPRLLKVRRGYTKENKGVMSRSSSIVTH